MAVTMTVQDFIRINQLQDAAVNEALDGKIPFTYLPRGANEDAQWHCAPAFWDPFDWVDQGIDPMTGVDLR